MKYHPELNYHRRKRAIFKARLALFLLVIGLFLMLLTGYFLLLGQKAEPANATSTPKTTRYASKSKVFQSPYFQFQLKPSWSEVPEETTPTKFVYRSYNKKLIEDEVVVYVNSIPGKLESNRVMPVKLREGGGLAPDAVTNHCLSMFGRPRIDSPSTNMGGVSFRCDADSTNYTVMVGQSGGSTVMTLKRPNGENASYTIYYTNLRPTPDSNQLTELADTFQTR